MAIKQFENNEWKTVSGASLGNIDTAMSDASTNPVQNKVIKGYVDNKLSDIVDDNTIVVNSSTSKIETSIGGSVTSETVMATDATLSVLAADSNFYTVVGATSHILSVDENVDFEIKYDGTTVARSETGACISGTVTIASSTISYYGFTVNDGTNDLFIIGSFNMPDGYVTGIYFKNSTEKAKVSSSTLISLTSHNVDVEYIDPRVIKIDNNTIKLNAANQLYVNQEASFEIITEADIDEILG